MIMVLLGMTFLIIGLINPKMGVKMEKVKRQGIDIVFAIDVSKSMLAEDVAPNRLEKSKQLVSQLINQLGGDKIGIIAYSGNAFPVLPMTSDYAVAKMFLQTMNPGMISSQGTSIDQAIELAANNFFDKKDKTSKLLVIISDGEDHSDNAEAAAEESQKVGLKIVTIGVGTEKGGPIPLKKNGVVERYQKDKDDHVVITHRNAKVLAAIAKTTKGGYVDGNSTRTVVDYVKKVLHSTQKSDFEGTMMADLKSQFQWFIAFGFIVLFVDVFLSERKTKWVRKLNLFNEEKEAS
jgi:Ca-activated chloride channel family protein